MKITKAYGGGDPACPNGWDCDNVYETDDPEDVLVRGRFLTAQDAQELGIRLPAHEGLLRIKRTLLKEAGR